MICSGSVVRSYQTNLIWINGHIPSDNLVEQSQSRYGPPAVFKLTAAIKIMQHLRQCQCLPRTVLFTLWGLLTHSSLRNATKRGAGRICGADLNGDIFLRVYLRSRDQQSAMQMNRCRHLVPLYQYHATNYNYYNLITVL